MTINEAIQEAKERKDWWNGLSVAYGTSVNIGFTNRENTVDETQLDLFDSRNYEKELNDLWEDLHNEFDADVDSIEYVEMLGYVDGYETGFYPFLP